MESGGFFPILDFFHPWIFGEDAAGVFQLGRSIVQPWNQTAFNRSTCIYPSWKDMFKKDFSVQALIPRNNRILQDDGSNFVLLCFEEKLQCLLVVGTGLFLLQIIGDDIHPFHLGFLGPEDTCSGFRGADVGVVSRGTAWGKTRWKLIRVRVIFVFEQLLGYGMMILHDVCSLHWTGILWWFVMIRETQRHDWDRLAPFRFKNLWMQKSISTNKTKYFIKFDKKTQIFSLK